MERQDEILQRIERIEVALRLLTQQQVRQEFYSTGDVWTSPRFVGAGNGLQGFGELGG